MSRWSMVVGRGILDSARFGPSVHKTGFLFLVCFFLLFFFSCLTGIIIRHGRLQVMLVSQLYY